MAWGRAALVLAVASVVAAALVSGGPRDESFRLPSDPDWLERAKPLGPEAPPWARRMYRRSLLVLRAMTNSRTGAVVAGRRDGWEYVWPRDAAAVAMALASAGYRDEAQRVVRFLLGLDLGAAARFYEDGTPVEGRAAQGDAAGWVDAAARAVGLSSRVDPQPWRDRADYQEGESGDYLGNAIASTTAGEPKDIPAGGPSVRRPGVQGIQGEFGAAGVLVREAGHPESGVDSAAAWAVRPFRAQSLYPDQADLLEHRDRELRPRDPDLLLDAWAQEYRFDRHDTVAGHVSGGGIEMARGLAANLGKARIHYAFTGLAAAWAIDSFARFRLATVYVDGDPRDAAERLDIRLGAKGANVQFLGPDDAGVFAGEQERDGLPCVSNVQVYLDLLHLPERATEAAQHLRDHHLDWHGGPE